VVGEESLQREKAAEQGLGNDSVVCIPCAHH